MRAYSEMSKIPIFRPKSEKMDPGGQIWASRVPPPAPKVPPMQDSLVGQRPKCLILNNFGYSEGFLVHITEKSERCTF